MIEATDPNGKLRTYKGTTSTEINYALSHSGNVNLDPTVLYPIKDPLLLPSNTTLDGNGATIKLAKGLSQWGYRKCPIKDEKAMLMIKNSSAKNVAIKNLTVDGSQSDYYPNVRLGNSIFNMATLIGVDGLTIENCTFKNGCNDAILLNKSKNIIINNIKVDRCGHDGVSTYHTEKMIVKDSTFKNRTNSSVRFYNVTDGLCIGNDMSTTGGGYTGVELQGNLKNCNIMNNYIHGLPYPGIVSLSAKMSNVIIENNLIEKCKSPGISVSGATLKNNTIK